MIYPDLTKNVSLSSDFLSLGGGQPPIVKIAKGRNKTGKE